jgi:acyl transferase domain-containing protein
LSPLLIGSVKSNMWHPEPASGNIQLLFKLINKMFHEVLNNYYGNIYYATFIDSLLLWV